MDSFGVRFSEDKYVKVDLDSSTGVGTVTLVFKSDGETITMSGYVQWDNPMSEPLG